MESSAETSRWQHQVPSRSFILALTFAAVACRSAPASVDAPADGVGDEHSVDAVTDSVTPSADAVPDTLPNGATPDADTAADSLTPPGVMAAIPAGDFWMGAVPNDPMCGALPTPLGCGAEYPQHLVHVNAFEIGVTEVTVAQYRACVMAGACTPGTWYASSSTPDVAGKEQFPINGVTWAQAVAYCGWIDARLPTEAEWERAARGGMDGFLYPWGDAWPTCLPGEASSAVFLEGAQTCGKDGPMAVGSRSAPNKFGLYDMAGNVWEWVADWYDVEYYKSQTGLWNNPQGPASSTIRGVRGGSFRDGSWALRISSRGNFLPTYVFDDVGIRCARDGK